MKCDLHGICVSFSATGNVGWYSGGFWFIFCQGFELPVGPFVILRVLPSQASDQHMTLQSLGKGKGEGKDERVPLLFDKLVLEVGQCLTLIFH